MSRISNLLVFGLVGFVGLPGIAKSDRTVGSDLRISVRVFNYAEIPVETWMSTKSSPAEFSTALESQQSGWTVLLPETDDTCLRNVIFRSGPRRSSCGLSQVHLLLTHALAPGPSVSLHRPKRGFQVVSAFSLTVWKN